MDKCLSVPSGPPVTRGIWDDANLPFLSLQFSHRFILVYPDPRESRPTKPHIGGAEGAEGLEITVLS